MQTPWLSTWGHVTWCYARVCVRRVFPTINLCARTAHCTAHDCICIADLAMIRDHRSWLLWETRRKVITDKQYCIRDIYVVVFGLCKCACIRARPSVCPSLNWRREIQPRTIHAVALITNSTCHAVYNPRGYAQRFLIIYLLRWLWQH